MVTERAVLTLAAGKPIYWQMAINLARSFLWWHKDSDIRFYIVTDLPTGLPSDLVGVELVRVSSDAIGQGFSAKLHLDELSPAKQTLFIDADCLLVGSLESVFGRFSGRHVSVFGGSISSGDWFGDVEALCKRFCVTALPKFNGGIYYFEQGSAARSVYAKARELEKNYDALGLVRLRGRPNDELLMAISMVLHGQDALPDDGSIMGELLSCPLLRELSVFQGKASLENPALPSFEHRAWYPTGRIYPKVVHFLGDFTNAWPYRAEALKLRLVYQNGIPPSLAGMVVDWCFSKPQQMKELLRVKLRPAYHSLFGARKQKTSNRI